MPLLYQQVNEGHKVQEIWGLPNVYLKTRKFSPVASANVLTVFFKDRVMSYQNTVNGASHRSNGRFQKTKRF